MIWLIAGPRFFLVRETARTLHAEMLLYGVSPLTGIAVFTTHWEQSE